MAISVLLLESDVAARAAYAKSLRDAGCTVQIARYSDQAHTAALTNAFDVVVIGFDRVHRDDRFELCRRLAEDSRTHDVPVLLTSRRIQSRDLEFATSTGVLALALEPLNAAKLVSAVQGVVAAHLRPRAVRASVQRESKRRPPRSGT